MKRIAVFVLAVLVTMALGSESLRAEQKKTSKKPMTRDQLINLALSGAPPHIAKDATVMIPGDDGKLMEVKKGTNGFTCVPDDPGTPIDDPICNDEAAFQWVTSLMNNDPKPANTVPGISYMAKGAAHWEKDGKILMKEEPGAKMVKEPPHWMVFWPFDSKASGIPSHPNPGGAWVMFDGTPYAHLMIYQDPKKLK
jgi:hypothetical protein